MDPKTLPTIWGTYMKLKSKYQISAINSCWEKCDEKCSYVFNVYKNQLSRQTGSRNLTGPKMLPTIWYTYMTLVTKYQISAINSYWEKCDKNILDGRTDRRTEVKQYTPLPLQGAGVYKWIQRVLIEKTSSVRRTEVKKHLSLKCLVVNSSSDVCFLIKTKENQKNIYILQGIEMQLPCGN
jgi:hypothetical protein